jgi:type I restriction enzyme, R subunit
VPRPVRAGEDKQDFRVFDFCFNFDFFRENPEGINAGDSAPLGTRLFRARVQLLGHVQANPELDPDAACGDRSPTACMARSRR